MTEIVFRTLQLKTRKANKDERTVPAVLSTDTPIERGDYFEVLDHAGADLSRAKDRGLPLIESHDQYRVNIGKVENIRVDDGRLVGSVRFGSSQRANELLADVADGIVDGLSIGYIVRQWEVDEDKKTYTARNWMPFETSVVSVPADSNAGFFRSIGAWPVPEGDSSVQKTVQDDSSEDSVGQRAEDDAAEPSRDESRKPKSSDTEKRQMSDDKEKVTPQEPEPKVDVKAVQNAEREKERTRIREITRIGGKFGMAELADKAIEEGRSVGEFQDEVLGKLDGVELRSAGPNEIGLTDKEKNRFSFVRMIRAQMPNASREEIKAAEFERDVCQAAADQYGRTPKGWLVPDDVIYLGQDVKGAKGRRDLLAGTATDGAELVSTDLLAGSFIEALRNAIVCERAGATVLPGLQGNIAIPRQTSGPTAYWVAENSVVTESDPQFDQVTMSPETVGAVTEISRKLLIQSSIGIENFVRMELASRIGIEIDRVCIEGSGTNNQPEGILNTTGIGAYSATSGVDAITWDLVVGLWKAVAVDNAAMGRLGWLANAAVIAKLMTTRMDTGSGRFVMERLTDGLLSYPVYRSENVPADLGSSGALGALIFGNFADLIVGYWSGVDVLVDPYSNSKSGAVRVVAMVDTDVDVRHPESFSASQDLVIA